MACARFWISLVLFVGLHNLLWAEPVPKPRPSDPLHWPYMGVRVQDTATMIIEQPEPGTGAYQAGLKGGDILVKIGTFEPKMFTEIPRYLFQFRPGTTLPIVVRRGEELVTVRLTLGTWPKEQGVPSVILELRGGGTTELRP